MTAAEQLLVLLCFVRSFSVCLGACGGVLSAGASSSGTIASPNFPSNYEIGQKCVWIIDAPANFAIKYNFTTLQMSATSGATCADYVEIRDGSRTANVLFNGCQQSTNTVIQSTGSYSWIKFYSNYAHVNVGFSAHWSVVHVGANNASVSRTCKIKEFQCPNYECISQGYLCDNASDCGCEDYYCDEGDFYCKPAQILEWEKYTVGLCLGVGVFLVIFFTCSFMESRHNNCPGYCAPQPQMHGPLKPRDVTEVDEVGYCGCKCCFVCCHCCNKQARLEEEARIKQEEEKRQLEQSYAQIMKIVIDGQQVIDWYADPDSKKTSTSVSRQTSISAEEEIDVLNLSYGNTLSPNDVPTQMKRAGGSKSKNKNKQTTVTV